MSKSNINFNSLEEELNILLTTNQLAIAVELCKDTFNAVAESGGPTDLKETIAHIIMMDELRKMHLAYPVKKSFDWLIFEKKMSLLDLDFSEEELKSFERTLMGEFDMDTYTNKLTTKTNNVIEPLLVSFKER